MGAKRFKLICFILLVAFVSVSLLIPAEAQAKISLKKFGRWMKKRIKRHLPRLNAPPVS